VGLLFDMRELRRDRDFIVNRIGVDMPPRKGDGESNLPILVESAYRRHVKQALANLAPRGV
jgi:hypothetical protein